MLKEIIAESKANMEKSINSLNIAFKRIRTGRASPSLLDDIKIDTVKSVDEVLKIALVKELKPVEWIEVENIPKPSNEKNVPGSTH